MPRNGGTPFTLHNPNHAIGATLVSAYRPQPRYIHTAHGYPMHLGPRRQRVSCIRNRGWLDLSYDAGTSCGRREAGRYECCWCGVVWDVEGGGGLSVSRHSYRGHGVEVWRTAAWCKKKITVASQATQTTRGRTWAYPGKLAQCVLDQWQGSWSVLLLDFSIICCGPQTDKVYITVSGRFFFRRRPARGVCWLLVKFKALSLY